MISKKHETVSTFSWITHCNDSKPCGPIRSSPYLLHALHNAQRYTPSNGNSYLCLCPAAHIVFSLNVSHFQSWKMGAHWMTRLTVSRLAVLVWWGTCRGEERLSRLLSSLLLAAPATGPGSQQCRVWTERGGSGHSETGASPPPCLVSPMTLAIIMIIITIIMTTQPKGLSLLFQAFLRPAVTQAFLLNFQL